MNTSKSPDYLAGLVRELCRSVGEVEWVEFKHEKAEPWEIGEFNSAIANAAVLNDREYIRIGEVR